MIRRLHQDRDLGPCFALITQDDHARLAGQLARHLGTSRYARPQPFESFIHAVDLHDAGWPLHDREPVLHDGRPLDVFETPQDVGLKVWSPAPELAAAKGAWAELLVSIHILTLSALATSHTAAKHEKFDVSSMAARFEMNKFQHREIERQERLRKVLGLSTEIPLSIGLAEENAEPREDILRQHYRWLQAMDLCSLALCCTEVPQDRTPGVYAMPGSQSETLALRRDGNDLVVTPWPFAVERIEVRIPCRLIPAQTYKDPADLHATLHASKRHTIFATVRPQ